MRDPQDTQAIISTLYEKYYDTLIWHCINQLQGNSQLMPYAEDIVQETFMVAIRKWKTIATHENPIGWLMQTCNFKIGNFAKKQQRRNKLLLLSMDEAEEPFVEDRSSRIDLIAQKQETAQHLEEILAILTDSERNAVVDHYDDNMTIPEMAEARRTTEGSQKAALRRAKKKAIEYKDKNIFMIFFIFMVSISTSWK